MSDTATLFSPPPDAHSIDPANGEPTQGFATPIVPPMPDGTVTEPDWKASLPENFRTVPALKVFEGFESQQAMLEALGKSYVETKSMVGKKLEPPAPDAPPEQQAYWRKVHGAPDAPDGYGDLKPDGFPDELWDKGMESKFAEVFHKHAISPSAAKDFANLHAEVTKGFLEQASQQNEAALQSETAALKAAWGSEFDSKLGLAKSFVEKGGMDLNDPVFRSATLIQGIAKLAAMHSSAPAVQGQPAGLPNAAGRVQEIMDPKSTSMLSRQYRGEFGQAAQLKAQEILLQLQSQS